MTRNFVTAVSMCGKTIIIMLIPSIDCMLIVVYMHIYIYIYICIYICYMLAQAFSLALVHKNVLQAQHFKLHPWSRL